MKILFSPSENKKDGGSCPVFSEQSFIFMKLYDKRQEVLKRYNKFISKSSDLQLSKLFGIKDSSKFAIYKEDIFKQSTMKAVARYDGVAFDYLQYETLSQSAQEYVDKNTIIFSNLFGPILAGDIGLVQYKLKQGEKIDNFVPEIHYKKYFSQALDEWLKDELFLDLRAGFYMKFYKPISPYITLKFLKNGKVVSHWAKAYRGIVLRQMALLNIKNIEDFYKMPIDNLNVEKIIQKKIHTEVIFTILS